MINLEMSKAVATMLADLLEKASDKFSNHGCNDFMVENTDENWELQEKCYANSQGMTVEELRETGDFERPAKGKIHFDDWILMSYFADQINSKIIDEMLQ